MKMKGESDTPGYLDDYLSSTKQDLSGSSRCLFGLAQCQTMISMLAKTNQLNTRSLVEIKRRKKMECH